MKAVVGVDPPLASTSALPPVNVSSSLASLAAPSDPAALASALPPLNMASSFPSLESAPEALASSRLALPMRAESAADALLRAQSSPAPADPAADGPASPSCAG